LALAVIATNEGLGAMATAEYHRRQADVLLRLADTTRDTDTAAGLRRLAAQHVAAADEIETTGNTERDRR
jgi:hypothetical protein